MNFTGSAVTTPTYSISGKVSGTAATLTLSGAGGGTANTDSSGNYTFTGLKNGLYVVAPSRSGYTFTPSTASVSVNGASVSGINFTASVAPVSHSVSLTWTASASSNVMGYNVYRSTSSGGQYAKLSSSPVSVVSFVDNNVVAGQTYYYVATAVDSSNNESGYSTQIPATIPKP